MNIWENAVITTKGRALLAKLIAGNTLAITRAVVGAGSVTPGLLLEQTNVTDAKQALSFTGIAYPEAGKCALSCNLRNDGVETGYTAMQVGVFATDPDDGEILFFITQAASGKGTEIPSKSEMGNFSAEWTFYFQYGQADNVNVTVDPAAAVTQAKMAAYVEEYIAEHVNPALTALNQHATDKKNPHSVTAEQVGAISKTARGMAGGVASLDEDGKVPEAQLPDITNIPVTNEVPADSDIWIDPDEESVEESHITNTNNPHRVTPGQIGAVPTTRKVNGKTLSSDVTLGATDVGAAPAYTYGTAAMEAGVTPLETGKIYFQYE